MNKEKASNSTNEIDQALKIINKYGKNISARLDDEASLGWCELSVGDNVYFKTYDDINDNIAISKGEIIEIITSEKKVMNKPDEKLKIYGWHRERSVSCKIRWNGMTTVVDSRYVYTNKLDALITTLNSTIESYLKF